MADKGRHIQKGRFSKARPQKKATRMKTTTHKVTSSSAKRARSVIVKKQHIAHSSKAKGAKPQQKQNTRQNARAKNRMAQHSKKPERVVQKPETQKATAAKDAVAAYVEAASAVINNIEGNEVVSSYLKKNVSRRAIEVMHLLGEPKTDEDIAMHLDMKINAVRRILNIMQGYGITNYNISKNVDGWLSFAWYINVNKIGQFFDYVKNMSVASDVVKDNCNDYYICNKCYSDNKLIFTFDAAYEAGFRCSCNNMLTRVGREEAEKLARGPSESLEAKPAVGELAAGNFTEAQTKQTQAYKARRHQ